MTPSRRDEPRTPDIHRAKDTPSKSAWDDDEDITPLKKSSWDILTPKSEGREDDHSMRSDKSGWSSRLSSRSHNYDKYDKRYMELFN